MFTSNTCTTVVAYKNTFIYLILINAITALICVFISTWSSASTLIVSKLKHDSTYFNSKKKKTAKIAQHTLQDMSEPPL